MPPDRAIDGLTDAIGRSSGPQNETLSIQVQYDSSIPSAGRHPTPGITSRAHLAFQATPTNVFFDARLDVFAYSLSQAINIEGT
jgi:hypothetical protein